jgi:uncharacterized membrane protein
MDGWELILLLLVVLLLIGPILGIAAWVRVRRLQRQSLPPEEVPRLLARIYKLELRLEKLEQRPAEPAPVAAAEKAPAPEPRVKPKEVAPPPAPAPPVTPASPPPVAPQAPHAREPLRPPSAPPQPPPPERPAFHPGGAALEKPSAESAFDLESLIAGRWLYYVGLALLFLATFFFIKYAFENNWIGPTGRVAIGILSGAFLLGFSHWLLSRGYVYFSEGLTGLGSGILYLSLWAGSGYYHLFSNVAAFYSMIVVTAATIAIAVGRDSQRIAALALIGGFLTPWLVSTGQNAQVELFSYVLLLDATLLVLARVRDWRWLEAPAFAVTYLYFWGWYDRFYDATQLPTTMLFAALFFITFTILPAIRSRQTAALYPEQVSILFLNAISYLLALRAMLWPDHKWMLTIAVLLLAALHLYIARFVPRPADERERPLAYFLYAGLALMFATLAIPIRLEGRWITIAWAVEGAVLMWTGFRVRMWQLRASAFLLFLFVFLRLFMLPEAAPRFLFNARFGIFAVVVACYVLSIWFWRQHQDEARDEEKRLFATLGVAANFLLVWALSMEVDLLFGPEPLGMLYLGPLARQMALTTFWCMYATVLLSAGLLRNIAGLRYQAYVLFAMGAGKLLFADTEGMNTYFAHFAFNPRFAFFAVIVSCFALALGLARRESESLPESEQKVMGVMGVLIHVIALLGLSVEVYQYFVTDPRLPLIRDTRLAQQMGLSLLWTVYATALVITGVRWERVGLRYQGLVLFAITIAKVFFYDLSYLSGIYRVVSSFALGVVLLAVAFIYQKMLLRKTQEEQ